ncbi:MAG TPA: FtsX-like permease family protein [Thermoanaerobaculia bacterium]|nr:FtsX-like permease family protein [Thermoanaerobaculia bacterium]
MKIPLKYNVRNLFVRKGTTLMTIGSIAFVVLVYVGVLAMAGGLRAAFSAAGDPSNVVVLRDGARSEVESFFSQEKERLLVSLPGVAHDAQGQPLATGQALILQILKRAGGGETNVSIRGVEPAAFSIRTQVRLIDGRRFEPGKAEIVVGRKLAVAYPALRLGATVNFGHVPFRVVGIFEAGGSSFESEVWGAVADLNGAFRRISNYSSALLHAASPDDARALIARIKGDQQLHLTALPEPQYYAEQANVASAQFIVLGNVLAFFLAVGACFAAANTMFAQVSARGHEIGTLRALGFRRHTILLAFMIEAAVLGLVAGVAGSLLALPLNGITAATMNGVTFSEISFSLRTAPWILGMGVLLALGTGVVGGFPAAWSAARRPITELLREH